MRPRRSSDDEKNISERLVREKGETPEQYNERVKAEVNKVTVDTEDAPKPVVSPPPAIPVGA